MSRVYCDLLSSLRREKTTVSPQVKARRLIGWTVNHRVSFYITSFPIGISLVWSSHFEDNDMENVLYHAEAPVRTLLENRHGGSCPPSGAYSMYIKTFHNHPCLQTSQTTNTTDPNGGLGCDKHEVQTRRARGKGETKSSEDLQISRSNDGREICSGRCNAVRGLLYETIRLCA